MKKHEAKGPTTSKAGAQKSAPRRVAIGVLSTVLFVGVLMGAFWHRARPAVLGVDAKSTETSAWQAANFPGMATNPVNQNLVGRWLRPDGGYILHIKSVDDSGKLEAAYFNPRPINVSQAVYSRQGSSIRVFVELRDVNYPGSTYTLLYDRQGDQLKGIYCQAAIHQEFDVLFERIK